MSLNAVFGSLCNIPDKIVFKINAISYSFMTISAVTSDKGGYRSKLSHQTVLSEDGCHTTTKKATDAAAEFGDIIFSGDQFITADMNGSFSPFRFAAKLAESSGNHARELPPSGGSLIFNTSESNPVYTPPADILSWVRSKPKKELFVYRGRLRQERRQLHYYRAVNEEKSD